MIESLEKTQKVFAQTYQEQEREVGKNSSQANIDPKKVIRTVPNCHTQDDLGWSQVIFQNSHPESKETRKQFY